MGSALESVCGSPRVLRSGARRRAVFEPWYATQAFAACCRFAHALICEASPLQTTSGLQHIVCLMFRKSSSNFSCLSSRPRASAFIAARPLCFAGGPSAVWRSARFTAVLAKSRLRTVRRCRA